MHRFLLFIIIFFSTSCSKKINSKPYVVVLGLSQDGGSPQAGCFKNCCINRWNNFDDKILITSIGIVDPVSSEAWMIEATPDFALQLNLLTEDSKLTLKGVFLTHAHVGHYSGLIHLGREIIGSSKIPVYAMEKMTSFLKSNGPWSQLVSLGNISLKKIQQNKKINLNKRISIESFIVPHRDEFSETVGYKIQGPSHSLLFIPDIDKWTKWDQDISIIITNNKYALLDGTFFDDDEIPGRDMSEIPHPFIIESMDRLQNVKNKVEINFIHLNHTNPALNIDSKERSNIENNGFGVASTGQRFKL